MPLLLGIGFSGVWVAVAPAPTAGAAPVPPVAGPTVGGNINIGKEPGNQSEGDIAVNPTNPQQLFAESNEEGLGLMVATSSDGGQTWSRRDIAAGSDGFPIACCDASVSWDGFGNLFVAYLDGTGFHVRVLLSTDGGATFTLLSSMESGDQPTIRTGPGNHPGTGSVWLTFTSTSTDNVVTSAASVTGLGSAKVGAFSAPFLVPGGAHGDFGDIAVGPSGQVVVTWETPHGDVGPAELKVSTNTKGLSDVTAFGAAVTASSTNVGGFDPIPAQQSRTIDAEPSLAWNDSGKGHKGRVYLAYTNSPAVGNSNTDIFVRFSDDDGGTWSTAHKVNDDTGTNSQFLPSIAVDQTTGELALSWYDARNDRGSGSGDTDGVPNDDAQIWGATSTDGATFSHNFRISSGTSNAADSQNGIEFGDYTHAAYFGGLYYAYWADNSNSTGDNPDGTLHGLDMYVAAVTVHARLSVTATVSVGSLPTGVVATNSRAYVANSLSNTVSVIDTTKSPPPVIDTIAVGAYPNGMALSADGSQLYVTNYLAAGVTIIRTSDDTVQSVTPVGSRPDGVAFFNGQAYVANLASGTISVVNPDGSLAGTITLPSGPSGAAAPSGLAALSGNLYVNDVRNGVTFQVTLPTTVAGTVAAGVHPAYISTLATTGYVASPGDNSIKVLDLATTPPTAVTSVTVGAAPYGVAADPAAKLVLATSSGANTVTAIDPATNTVIGLPVAVGKTPDTVAVSPDGATAFVTNEGDGTLSVLHVAP